ncbi:hypothetical protein [Actinorhabdospora filicis]|uniref:hypothetical protein n=1 Tax=Actinorhabdospora filicis TaxID=1785913 RepID=UPI002554557A|nr:hypothetical protein [Actinorhabdospora filicis]
MDLPDPRDGAHRYVLAHTAHIARTTFATGAEYDALTVTFEPGRWCARGATDSVSPRRALVDGGLPPATPAATASPRADDRAPLVLIMKEYADTILS